MARTFTLTGEMNWPIEDGKQAAKVALAVSLEYTSALPAAALGEMIALEFRMVSDDFDNAGTEVYSGWYIDDVELTTRP